METESKFCFIAFFRTVNPNLTSTHSRGSRKSWRKDDFCRLPNRIILRCDRWKDIHRGGYFGESRGNRSRAGDASPQTKGRGLPMPRRVCRRSEGIHFVYALRRSEKSDFERQIPKIISFLPERRFVTIPPDRAREKTDSLLQQHPII